MNKHSLKSAIRANMHIIAFPEMECGAVLGEKKLVRRRTLGFTLSPLLSEAITCKLSGQGNLTGLCIQVLPSLESGREGEERREKQEGAREVKRRPKVVVFFFLSCPHVLFIFLCSVGKITFWLQKLKKVYVGFFFSYFENRSCKNSNEHNFV